MFKLFIVAIVFLFTHAVQANDTTVTIAAGGIQYKKSDKISMDEEVLKISVDQIEIAYRFFNHADKDIREVIAFPLPLAPQLRSSPTWDEEYLARSFLLDGEQCNLKCQYDSAAFINFERTVNGAPYGYHYRVEAWHNTSGKNITALLKQHHIPLSAAYLAGYQEQGELDRNPTLKAMLKKLNLLDDKNIPVWKTQTTYFWTQNFPAKTAILTTHTYRPRTGMHWIKLDPNMPDKVVLESLHPWTDYCPSKDDDAAIVAAFKKNVEGNVIRAYEVQYILVTGANWNGPIKKFRLEIKPPTPKTRVIFCWDGKIEKGKNGTLVSTLENFTPKTNLKVLFVDV